MSVASSSPLADLTSTKIVPKQQKNYNSIQINKQIKIFFGNQQLKKGLRIFS